MEKLDKKKIVVSSMLATAALAGGAAVMQGKVSATTQDAEASAVEETGASATEGVDTSTTDNNAETSTTKAHKSGRKHGHKKPANMTDEEWAAKKAERKAKLAEKLAGMSDEEKQEWLKSHKKGNKVLSDSDTNISN